LRASPVSANGHLGKRSPRGSRRRRCANSHDGLADAPSLAWAVTEQYPPSACPSGADEGVRETCAGEIAAVSETVAAVGGLVELEVVAEVLEEAGFAMSRRSALAEALE
jgi:hypothetical protein